MQYKEILKHADLTLTYFLTLDLTLNSLILTFFEWIMDSWFQIEIMDDF